MLVKAVGSQVREDSLLHFIEMSSRYDFVINKKDMGLNVVGKNGRTDYVEKASFSLELLQHIDVGHHKSGFRCRVYCSLREEAR